MEEKKQALRKKILQFVQQIQNSLIDNESKLNFQQYLSVFLKKMNDDSQKKDQFINDILDIYKDFFYKAKLKNLLAIQLVIYSLCQNISSIKEYSVFLQNLSQKIENFNSDIVHNMKLQFQDEKQINEFETMEQFQLRDYLKLNIVLFYKIVLFLDEQGFDFQDLLTKFEQMENFSKLKSIIQKKINFHIENEKYDYFNNTLFDLELQFLDIDKGITEKTLTKIERNKIFDSIQKNEQNFQKFFQEYLNYSRVISLIQDSLNQNLNKITEDKKHQFYLDGQFLTFLNSQIEKIGSTSDKLPQKNLQEIQEKYKEIFLQTRESLESSSDNIQQQNELQIKKQRQSMQNVKSDISDYKFHNKYFHKTKSITIGKQIELDVQDNSSQTIDIDQFEDFDEHSEQQEEEPEFKKKQIFLQDESASQTKTFLEHFQDPQNKPESVIYKVFVATPNFGQYFDGFKNNKDQLSEIEKISGRSSFIGKSAVIFYGKDKKSRIDLGQSQISKNSSKRKLLRNFLQNKNQIRLQNQLQPIRSKQTLEPLKIQENTKSLQNNNFHIELKKQPIKNLAIKEQQGLQVNKSKSMQKGLDQFQNFDFKKEIQDKELFKTEITEKKTSEHEALNIQDFQTDSEFQNNTEMFNDFNNSQTENNFNFQEQILPPSVVQKPPKKINLDQSLNQSKMDLSSFQQKLDNLQNNIKKTQSLFQELETNKSTKNQKEVLQNIKENFELMNFLYTHKDYHQQTIFYLNNELTQLKDEIIAKNEIQNSLQDDLNFKTEKLFMMKKDLQKKEVIAQVRKEGLKKWKNLGLKLKRFLNSDIRQYKQQITRSFQELYSFLNHVTNKKNKSEIKFQFQQQKNIANFNEIQILKKQKDQLQFEIDQKNFDINQINQNFDKIVYNGTLKLADMKRNITILRQSLQKTKQENSIAMCHSIVGDIKNNYYHKKSKIQQFEFLKKEIEQYKHKLNVQHNQNQYQKEKIIDYEDQLRVLKIKIDQNRKKDSILTFQQQINKKEIQQEKMQQLKEEFDEKINEIIEQKQKVEEENLILFEENQRLKSKFPTDRLVQNIQDLEQENEKLFEENQRQLKEIQYMKTGPNSYDILRNKVMNYEQTLENLKLNYKRNLNVSKNQYSPVVIFNTNNISNNDIKYNQGTFKTNKFYQSQFSENNGLKGTAFIKKFQVYMDAEQEQIKRKKNQYSLLEYWRKSYNKDQISEQAIQNRYVFFSQNGLQIDIDESIETHNSNYLIQLDLFVKNLTEQTQYIINFKLDGEKKLFKVVNDNDDMNEFKVGPYENKVFQFQFELETSYIIKNCPLFITFTLLNQIQMNNLQRKQDIQTQQYFYKTLLPLTINKFFEYIEEKAETFNLVKKLTKISEIVLNIQRTQIAQVLKIFPQAVEISSILNQKSYGTKIKTIFGNNLVVILVREAHIKFEIYSIQKNTVNQLYCETLKILGEYLENL